MYLIGPNIRYAAWLQGLASAYSGAYQWLLTGKANDIIPLAGGGYGYKNHGTGLDVDGKILNTQILTLDGIGSYIQLPSAMGLLFTDQIKIKATFNLSSLSRIYSTRTSMGWEFYIDSSGTLRLYINDGIASVNILLLSNVNDIYINTTLTANLITGDVEYTVNGVDYTLSTPPMNSIASNESKIGNFGSSYANGQLMNVTVYPSILSDNPLGEYNFQDAQGTKIADSSGNGNHGTLIGAIQEEAWGTKSDEAYPALLAKGGSKYLVCESAGTTAMLADPNGENVGVEEIVNGGFKNWTGVFPNELPDNWTRTGIPDNNNFITEVNGAFRLVSDGISVGIYQPVLTAGKYYLVEFDLIDNTGSGWEINVGSGEAFYGPSYNVGHHKILSIAGSATLTIKRGGACDATFDNISVKEVTPIPILGNHKLKLKPTLSDTYYIDSSDITSANGYMIRTTPTAITLFRVDVGVLTQLDTSVITYDNYDLIELIFTGSEIIVNVAGVEELNSNDITYTEFKLLVVNNAVGDIITRISFNNVKYDVSDFSDGTGSYKVKNSIAIDNTGLDAEGNALEYEPNKGFWNTGNSIDWIRGDASLQALADLYNIGNPRSFDQIKAIDLSGIPESHLIYTVIDVYIKNWVAANIDYELDSELDLQL
jgi:hypothetical protein